MTTTHQPDTSDHYLTLPDISDLRAYEREREAFRSHVIALKKLRRVHVGEFMTFVFENRDTVRFQIQEMARAEKIATDEGIETELRMYNPLISAPGKLSATMFIELTSDEQLREWLPKLAGVERSYELHLGEGDYLTIVPGQLDAGHDASLTREETTACVHYLWWAMSTEAVELLSNGPAKLVCTHPEYGEELVLSAETRQSLVNDLR